jgi:endonuclease YncB( thermonuclease family)
VPPQSGAALAATTGGALGGALRLVVVGVVAVAASGARAQDAAPCNPSRAAASDPVAVTAVIDARTLALADGRALRLSGIEVPGRGEPYAAEAQAALARRVAGRRIAWLAAAPAIDRYGRVLAAAAAVPADDAVSSLQQWLLAHGHARVAARVGDLSCAKALWAAETPARGSGLGLWKDPYYAVRRAENPREVLAERGRFALVEGNVVSVRESGGTVYVNFGRRWSEDFTVTVLKRNERAFAATGFELQKLSGRNVRVRGTVEERGGPWIAATRPEQFEIAERN